MTNIVFPVLRPSRTKIVATVGPASDSEVMLGKLIQAGVDVFRLNMAHGGPEDAQPRLDRIRNISRQLAQPVAVLADLAGPKMRLGEIPGDVYECNPDVPMKFIRGTSTTEPNCFTTTYEPLVDELEVGNRIMLADGTVALEVTEKAADHVVCTVLQGGPVRSRQGVNLPGAKLSVKTLQPKDVENAKWAVGAGVDFLGLSFVRTAADVHELRSILTDTAKANGLDEKDIPHIIPKIEKPEAVDKLDEIADAADGIMVARGDLGVEYDIAQIAVVQKRIIEICRKKCKPVIVATQMLESMHHQTIPTRAEATDVANAILDGTDACMLSGETAVGEHPIQAVAMMHRIAVATEKILPEHFCMSQRHSSMKTQSITDAVCDAANRLADDIDAALVLVASRTGRTALCFSNKRCFTMSVGTSSSERALRRMALYWGVIPLFDTPEEPRENLLQIVESGKAAGYLKPGDRVVLVSGLIPTGEHRNVLYVHVVD